MLKFGIYTSFYNCEQFIENAFHQIESLNYDNFEWHIVDDFSTDNTKSILLERIHVSPIAHKIKYYNQSVKKEMYWAPNLFFDASFDWIVLIDADDCVDSNFLKIYNNILSDVTDVTLVSSDFHKINYDNNTLHSISYILNDEKISNKINRYHPNCNYLNNVSYSCFGHLRAFKNLSDIKFEIKDRLAGAEDSYHIFWGNSYGKYLHIPRPLYRWNMHNNSESHSTNILPNFNGNFDIALNKLKESDFGVDTYYNDVYVETCALGSYEFGKVSNKKISLWSRYLNTEQRQKLTNLYIDCKLSFNDNDADIHIVCLNYFTDSLIETIINKNRNKSILCYYQNQKMHFNDDEKDNELVNQNNKYTSILTKLGVPFYWWSYIRHLIFKVRS
jgi:glycosyltransferase involved in cell wall biosynthesis